MAKLRVRFHIGAKFGRWAATVAFIYLAFNQMPSWAQREPTCNCSGKPQAPPAEECKPCKCNAAAPAKPTTPCNESNLGKKEKKESEEGVCKGTRKDCEKDNKKDRKCKKTSEWECQQIPPETGTIFEWVEKEKKDTCPSEPNRKTEAAGKCEGNLEGCAKKEKCKTITEWECFGEPEDRPWIAVKKEDDCPKPKKE
jgi:hypothetical protein